MTVNESSPSSACTHSGDTQAEMAGLRAFMRWVVVLFSLLISLVGYDIHTTQQMKVQVTKKVGQIGSQISSCYLKIERNAEEIEGHGQWLREHEKRIQSLEQGN